VTALRRTEQSSAAARRLAHRGGGDVRDESRQCDRRADTHEAPGCRRARGQGITTGIFQRRTVRKSGRGSACGSRAAARTALHPPDESAQAAPWARRCHGAGRSPTVAIPAQSGDRSASGKNSARPARIAHNGEGPHGGGGQASHQSTGAETMLDCGSFNPWSHHVAHRRRTASHAAHSLRRHAGAGADDRARAQARPGGPVVAGAGLAKDHARGAKLRYPGESLATVAARIDLLVWISDDPHKALRHLARTATGWRRAALLRTAARVVCAGPGRAARHARCRRHELTLAHPA